MIDLDFKFGGNYKSYFKNSLTLSSEDQVSKEAGVALLNEEGSQSGSTTTGQFNSEYTPVFTIADPIAIEARRYYEEDYDIGVSVIAGSGRSLNDAQDIWNQFRSSYHTYESVKKIFMDMYGLNPEDNEEFPPEIKAIFGSVDIDSNPIFKKFKESGNSANDEFSILFGNEITGSQSLAIEFARRNYIDLETSAPQPPQGIVEYFNSLAKNKIKDFKQNFLFNNEAIIKEQAEISLTQSEFIKTPRQLFLTMVGLFRQKMWQDPYARAWLVLKPSRKIGIGIFGLARGENWDFKSVDKIFAAFINPTAEYAKPNKVDQFKKLLYSNKGQGSDAGNIFSRTVKGVDNFLDASIGPIFSAMGAALSGLQSMFSLNMLQTGYGLSEIGSLSKQANILNKALNDSIYYSLGRPGSILRAVDNPFTREYGEPVVEVREPFQRIHYLSSFSHILSNQIKETNFNVSTVITAVSDGKFPVTVALDKGAPADRMIESTVETGIYFDNPIGDGFLGWLHPLIHPFEAQRGLTKNMTGAPDELLAKRIGLAHLKENIKDIYGGELLVIGNADIRPHDLVYIADVYERMYGMFEVEQVIHHFTSEMGYVTSITPNALVTVNDPARWYMTSWYHSWMNTQAIRNDTRLYMGSLQAGNTGISSGGNISVDRLSQNLNPQMMGGIQYTHGASAVIKDTVAAMTYDGFAKNPSFTDALQKQAQINGNNGALGGTAAVLAASQLVPIFGNLIWRGWTWVRDNLLDQHGAYVQYLNKNGQPMDAGLSYNQGMVVGRYHSKALLPGILGIRKKTRTIDGHAYIRTDDLMKSLGWQETEIKDLVRYISYENALIHAKVLDLSSLGPEKSGFEPFYKVICKLDDTVGIPTGEKKSDGTPILSGVLDGDTIGVVDVLSYNGKQYTNRFRVRLDGINTPESSIISTQYEERDLQNSVGGRKLKEIEKDSANPTLVDITYTNTEGYKATSFTANALKNKLFVLRIKENKKASLAASPQENVYDPGSSYNKSERYLEDIYERALATIFYKTSSESLEKIKIYVLSLFLKHENDTVKINKEFKESFYNSFFSQDKKFEAIFKDVNPKINHWENFSGQDNFTSQDLKNLFSKLVEIKIIEELYMVSSKWPIVLWDEYYNDGTPYTLNWELVTKNLANVFTNDLVRVESDSVVTAKDASAIPYRAGN